MFSHKAVLTNLFTNTSQKEKQIDEIMSSLSLEESLKESLSLKQEQEIDVRRIVKVIQGLLSDRMLYENKKLKHTVLSSKNGWMKINSILNLNQIKTVLKDVQLFNLIDNDLLAKFIKTYNSHIPIKGFGTQRTLIILQRFFGQFLSLDQIFLLFKLNSGQLIEIPKKSFEKTLSLQIQLNPCSLKANKKYLRRKVAFVDKAKNVRPIYVQHYRQEYKMKNVIQDIESMTQVYRYKFKVGQLWSYIYAAQPDKVLSLSQSNPSSWLQMKNQHESDVLIDTQIKMNFNVESFENIIANRVQVNKDEKQYLSQTILKSFPQTFKAKTKEQIKNMRQTQCFPDYIAEKLEIQNSDCELERQQIQRTQTRPIKVKQRNAENGLNSNQLYKRKHLKFKQLFEKFRNFYQPNLSANQAILQNLQFRSENYRKQQKLDMQIEKSIDQSFGEYVFSQKTL